MSSSETRPSRFPFFAPSSAPRLRIASVNASIAGSSIATAPGSTITWPSATGGKGSSVRPNSDISEAMSKSAETSRSSGTSGTPSAVGWAGLIANSGSTASGEISNSWSSGSAERMSISSNSDVAFSTGLVSGSGEMSSIAGGSTSTWSNWIGLVRISSACWKGRRIFTCPRARKATPCKMIASRSETTTHQPRWSGPGSLEGPSSRNSCHEYSSATSEAYDVSETIQSSR